MLHPVTAFLRRFKDISAADALLIEDAWKERLYKEGEYLKKTAAIAHELFLITAGVVRIVQHNAQDAEVTLYFLKEQQLCTILNSFTKEETSTEGIQAACEVTVYAIHKLRLLELYRQLPYLQPLLNERMQQGLLDKIQIRNAYLGMDSTERYKIFIERQADIALRVPLSDVASYLGITPQSLSRIRKNIQQQ